MKTSTKIVTAFGAVCLTLLMFLAANWISRSVAGQVAETNFMKQFQTPTHPTTHPPSSTDSLYTLLLQHNRTRTKTIALRSATDDLLLQIDSLAWIDSLKIQTTLKHWQTLVSPCAFVAKTIPTPITHTTITTIKKEIEQCENDALLQLAKEL